MTDNQAFIGRQVTVLVEGSSKSAEKNHVETGGSPVGSAGVPPAATYQLQLAVEQPPLPGRPRTEQLLPASAERTLEAGNEVERLAAQDPPTARRHRRANVDAAHDGILRPGRH